MFSVEISETCLATWSLVLQSLHQFIYI